MPGRLEPHVVDEVFPTSEAAKCWLASSEGRETVATLQGKLCPQGELSMACETLPARTSDGQMRGQIFMDTLEGAGHFA